MAIRAGGTGTPGPCRAKPAVRLDRGAAFDQSADRAGMAQRPRPDNARGTLERRDLWSHIDAHATRCGACRRAARSTLKDRLMRFLLVFCVLLMPLTARAEELTVFAAASLTDAMNDVSAQWVKPGHQPLRMSFGSSSTLARQIEQGAPANVFASADEKWMDYLQEKNLIIP